MTPFLELLAPAPVIAVLRAPDANLFRPATEVLYLAGIRCVEFTLTTEGAMAATEKVIASLPDDLLVGVGTVRTVAQVIEAIDAGADFLMSPTLRPELVAAAQERRIPFFPGGVTPTEIVNAWESGVPAVKVSPIGWAGGLKYFEHLRAQFPDIALLPTGGIHLDQVRGYLTSGAVAVGLGEYLLGDSLLPGGDLGALARRTERALDAVSTW